MRPGTPQWWQHRLAPGVSNADAWKIVGHMARAYLSEHVPEWDMITTATLVEGLYPERLAKVSAEGIAARRRIIDALISKTGCIKYELADCVTFGAPIQRRVFGKAKKVKPRLWHAPREAA